MANKQTKFNKSTSGEMDSRSNHKASGRNNRNPRKGRRKKEVEVNVDDDRLNRADLVIGTGRNVRNDPAWYNNIKPLTDDFATYPFNAPLGNGVNLRNTYENPSAGFAPVLSYTVPGIMQFAFSTTVGRSDNPNSAVNIAAQQIYTLTRKANSGAINYDKTEMMMYIIAMGNAYMLYEELARGYRTICSYNYMNRYMPRTLAYALGFDPKLQSSLKDWKGLLDVFAYKLSSLCVPNEFDFIKRWQWLCQNVYKDSEIDRAQLYIFRPDTYLVWTEGSGSDPTYLKCTPCQTVSGKSNPIYQSVEDMYTAMNYLLDPILGSEDAGVISGDIMKAFGSENMIKIALIEENSQIEPAYEPEVLNAIANTIALNPLDASLDVTQNLDNLTSGPYLYSMPAVQYTKFYFQNQFTPVIMSSVSKILNMHDENPTPDNIMAATRMMATCQDDVTPRGAASGATYMALICGTEVVNQIRMFGTPDSKADYTATDTLNQAWTMCANDANEQHTMQEIGFEFNMLSKALKFDWCPPIYYCTVAAKTAPYGELNFNGTLNDIDNYTILQNPDLRDLHDVALMSLFAVKSYTKHIG